MEVRRPTGHQPSEPSGPPAPGDALPPPLRLRQSQHQIPLTSLNFTGIPAVIIMRAEARGKWEYQILLTGTIIHINNIWKGTKVLPPSSCLFGILILSCLLRNRLRKKLWPSPLSCPRDSDRETCFRKVLGCHLCDLSVISSRASGGAR